MAMGQAARGEGPCSLAGADRAVLVYSQNKSPISIKERSMSSAQVFREYLDRFTAGDLDGARELLAEDFSFRGPMLEAEGRDAFLEGASGLAPIVRGNQMLRQWEDGEEVCSVYEFSVETPAGSGSIPMTEWVR